MFFESLFHSVKPFFYFPIRLWMSSSCCPEFNTQNFGYFYLKSARGQFSFFIWSAVIKLMAFITQNNDRTHPVNKYSLIKQKYCIIFCSIIKFSSNHYFSTFIIYYGTIPFSFVTCPVNMPHIIAHWPFITNIFPLTSSFQTRLC